MNNSDNELSVFLILGGLVAIAVAVTFLWGWQYGLLAAGVIAFCSGLSRID